MSSADAHRIVLNAHPSTGSDAVDNIDAQVSVTDTGVLTLKFSLNADMTRLRIPSEGDAGRADGLWKHTCFEAFIQPYGSREYYELNFSPSRQWAIYRFDGYREGMAAVPLTVPPEISTHRTPRRLELNIAAHLPSALTAVASPRPKLALTAVVEEENGRLCYWSARHPPGKPDFHHPDGFAFEWQP